MANRRTYDLQRIVSNGVAVPGARSLSLDANYSTVLESDGDGAYGSEDVDRGGLSIPVSLECTDVLAMATLLAATPGNTTWSGRESGASTWKNFTIASPHALVWLGATMRVAKTADSNMSYTGRVRFGTEAATIADVIAVAAGAANPTNAFTSPTRFWQPRTLSFTPYGGSAVAPLHVQSFEMSVQRNVITDWSDADTGETAVDPLNWQALRLTITHRDANAVAPGNIQSQLLGAGRGVLALTLRGRGGAGDQILTVNNVLLTGGPTREGREYTEFTISGVAGWKKRVAPAADYSMDAEVGGTTRLFSFAAA